MSGAPQLCSGRLFPAVDGVSHRFVEVGGVRVHVAEAGGGDPVVLLHGFAQHWYAWHRVIPLLADRYRLVCPDLVGYGWSDTPRHGYGTAERRSWLLGLLEVLDLRQVRLVGHETGGWLALVAGLEHPDRFTHLAALNVAAPWTPRRRLAVHAWRNWYTGIVEQPLIGRLALQLWAALDRFLLSHYATSPWDPAVLDEFVTAIRAPRCARAAEIQTRRFVFEDIWNLAVGRYRHQQPAVPVLLLGGERDFFTPPKLLQAAELPGGNPQIRIVAGAGHYLPEEQPDVVTGHVVELFGRHDREPTGAPGGPPAVTSEATGRRSLS